jgi:hypothetical protein
MITQQAERTTFHPFRDMIDPQVEQPIETANIQPDRRRYQRYARRLPCTLVTHAGEHAATCLDVGYGGIRLSTRDSVEVDKGSRVAACVKLGVSSFEDWFTVADARVTDGGTTLHLRL